jgi:hypothetical protein
MKIIIFVLGILLFLPQLTFALELYVAPHGSDGNPGTKDKPFQTLVAARDSIRKINSSMTEDIVVYIRGGSYSVTKAIEFESQDSGFNGHKVIYRAFNNEIPVFSGGIELTNWSLYNKDKSIYQSKVPKGIYRQLYIDGKRAIRARTPNKTSETTFGPYFRLSATSKRELLVAENYWLSVADLKNLNQVELVVGSHWYHQRFQIGNARSTKDGIVVTPLNPKGKMTKPIEFYNNSTFYFENDISFLDSGREWYHNVKEQRIYLAVESGADVNRAQIIIPRTETLLSVNGAAERRVENLEFQGLVFEHTNWNGPSKMGLNVDQFAQPIEGKLRGLLPAAFSVRHTKQFAVRNSIFRNIGANAIYMHNADHTDIEGNKFYQISANAIVIDNEKRNPKPDEQSQSVAVWNNYIKKVGQDYTNGGGVFANNVSGLIVEHNLLYDMPYSGVQICNQPRGLNSIGCEANRICYNHVHHVVQLHDDGGGIYTLGGIQKGTVIAENFLHDIKSGEWAGSYPVSMIYLDNHTSQITVRDNVIRGGKAEERNGSKNNYLFGNVQSDKNIESNAGIKNGYNPRLSSCHPKVSENDTKQSSANK